MRIKAHKAKEILEQVEKEAKNFEKYGSLAEVPAQTSKVIGEQFEYFLS